MMPTRPDPLRQRERPERVHYATGALLSADDFTAEQTYHRGRLARALAYMHGSGTVAGLRVDYEPEIEPGLNGDYPEGRAEQLVVRPGIALDPLGRMIEISRAYCLRLGVWYGQQDASVMTAAEHDISVPEEEGPVHGVVVDLFALFISCERGKTPAFAAGPFDALDAVEPSRVRDEHKLTLLLRDENIPPDPVVLMDLAPLEEGEARAELHSAILDAWREGTVDEGDAETSLLHAHAEGQDPTSVFLARVVIETEPGVVDGDGRPTRTEEESVFVLNELRPFVYSTQALARWLGV